MYVFPAAIIRVCICISSLYLYFESIFVFREVVFVFRGYFYISSLYLYFEFVSCFELIFVFRVFIYKRISRVFAFVFRVCICIFLTLENTRILCDRITHRIPCPKYN